MNTDRPGAMSAGEYSGMREMLARLDERTGSIQLLAAAAERAAELRHAENKATMSNYVPRAEIEQNNHARDARIASLESFRHTVYRMSLAVGGLVIGGLIFVGKWTAGALHLP